MEPSRPDPDALLAQVAPPEPPRGFLKVFLGYAAGVGKSFAMLQAANAALLQGRDVLIGWIEPHSRPDTMLLMAGMQAVPRRTSLQGNLHLNDLDLDACLKRKPEVLLVDELAHTNAPGGRHKKRWQDIEELLAVGIEVWTTVNIQHLDSMNDVVARVTGVMVQETVPDRIFDEAREVEVVDVDPEDLIDRLKQGKIYKEEQARRALESFFKKENLLALRELTLRRAAERVGKEVDSARSNKKVQDIWPVRERLMVSVGPSPLSEDLLRQASRLARTLDAELLAVSIETPTQRVQNSQAQARLAKNLAVAESLGAETVVLQGEEVAKDLIAYARKRNVTRLVVGKNRDKGWFRLWKRTIGDDLLRLSGDIDVYVLSGRRTESVSNQPTAPKNRWPHWSEWLWSVMILAGFTALAALFRSWGMAEANIVLTLLMSVVFSAALFGLSASIVTSLLAVFAFNFFFTSPRYSLAVDDPQYYLVFLFLLVVGIVIGSLTQRLRVGIQTSREREHRMETLNRMHRELSTLVEASSVREASRILISEIVGGHVDILQRDAHGSWVGTTGVQDPDLPLFDWAWNHGQRAGRGTGTLFDHRLSVWPLVGSRGILGLLVLENPTGRNEWIESLTALVASALERVNLIESARVRDRMMEMERTRNALLHSLSHDLRTPLTIIGGSLETLVHSSESQWSPRDKGLMAAVQKEAGDLGRQVESLLDLSRLTERGIALSLEQVPLEEPLVSVVEQFQQLHPGVSIKLEVPSEVVVAAMEPTLVAQAIANYLDNAWEYSDGKPMLAAVRDHGSKVRYEIQDQGPGVPPENREIIFQKFFRGQTTKTSGHRGTGVGLAIVREVARIHRGKADVEERPGGGSIFFLEFPKESP